MFIIYNLKINDVLLFKVQVKSVQQKEYKVRKLFYRATYLWVQITNKRKGKSIFLRNRIML